MNLEGKVLINKGSRAIGLSTNDLDKLASNRESSFEAAPMEANNLDNQANTVIAPVVNDVPIPPVSEEQSTYEVPAHTNEFDQSAPAIPEAPVTPEVEQSANIFDQPVIPTPAASTPVVEPVQEAAVTQIPEAPVAPEVEQSANIFDQPVIPTPAASTPVVEPVQEATVTQIPEAPVSPQDFFNQNEAIETPAIQESVQEVVSTVEEDKDAATICLESLSELIKENRNLKEDNLRLLNELNELKNNNMEESPTMVMTPHQAA